MSLRMEQRRRLSFGTVQVREYNRIAGDHPDVSEGPALALDWKFVQKAEMPLSQYEEMREDRMDYIAPLNSETRRFILSIVFEIPSEKIQRAEEKSERAKLKRQATFNKQKEQGLLKQQNSPKKNTRRYQRRRLVSAANNKGPSWPVSKIVKNASAFRMVSIHHTLSSYARSATSKATARSE